MPKGFLLEFMLTNFMGSSDCVDCGEFIDVAGAPVIPKNTNLQCFFTEQATKSTFVQVQWLIEKILTLVFDCKYV